MIISDRFGRESEVPEVVGVAGSLPGEGEHSGVRAQAGACGRADEEPDEAHVSVHVPAWRHRPVRPRQHHGGLQSRQHQAPGLLINID